MDSVVLRFAGVGKQSVQPDLRASDFRIVQRWGVASRPVRELPEFMPGQPLEGILNTNGEWWAVCRDSSGRTLVLADPFSLQPLYYAHVWTPQGATLLLGPQLDATARAMHAVGAKVETEWAGVLPSLSAKHDIFDTMYDVLTPVARLQLSRPDQAFLISDDGYCVTPRPSPALASSYEELLEAGVHRATREITTTLDHTGAEQSVLNLSGGKDSRLVLALLMTAGIGDRLQVHAVDPGSGKPGWQRDILSADLEISSRLAARFGLSWAHGHRPRQAWPDTLDGQLFRFQRHRGGRSYQFKPLSTTYLMEEPQVRFTGAGAGALRSPWASAWEDARFWKELGGTPETFNADAMRVFRVALGSHSTPKAIESRAMNRFVVTLREISGDGTIHSAVAAHYRSFRNRGHVGGLVWGRTYGVINSNPLLQPEFLAASRMLPAEERDAGRMTYDLLELMDPALNDLEFQSGPWPWAASRLSHLDWSRYPSDSRGFAASLAARPKPQVTVPFPARPRPSMQRLIGDGLAQLRQALTEAKHPGGQILGTLQAARRLTSGVRAGCSPSSRRGRTACQIQGYSPPRPTRRRHAS